jgi:hypothetical protein
MDVVYSNVKEKAIGGGEVNSVRCVSTLDIVST